MIPLYSHYCKCQNVAADAWSVQGAYWSINFEQPCTKIKNVFPVDFTLL